MTIVDGLCNYRPQGHVSLVVGVAMITDAITHCRGQMSEVARRLRIGRSTLYRKLKELGLDEDAGRNQAENVASG